MTRDATKITTSISEETHKGPNLKAVEYLELHGEEALPIEFLTTREEPTP